MIRSTISKVMWAGRATVFLVGLAVILALMFGAASTAFAHKGDKGFFHLGHNNVAKTVSTLVKKGAGPALSLKVGSGPPLAVNSGVKVANLNSDKLDGLDESALLRKTGKAADADKLDGKEPGELPGVVVSTKGFAGSVGSIAGSNPSWVFAGPTAQVTTTTSSSGSTQRLVGAAEAPLALSTSSLQSFEYGLCYQPSDGGGGVGPITNFFMEDPDDHSVGEATATRVSWSATATVVPGEGTWNVGFCVRNIGGAALDDNGPVNGWVQVVNP